MADEVQDVQINQDDTNNENKDSFMDSLPSDAQDYIKQLRAENAKNRVKKNEVNTKYEEALKKSAELDALREETARQNGEFEKLYNAEKEKASKLEALEDKIVAYELSFAEQFDTISRDLSPIQLELIKESNMGIEKKIQWANKLKSENKGIVESPSNERAGSSSKSSTLVIDNYKNGNMDQRSQILFETKSSNPKLYTQLLNL